MNLIDLLLDAACQDTQVLQTNQSHGDIISIPRDVEFRFYANDRSKANVVASFVSDNQYGIANVQPSGNKFIVSVTIHMPISQNILCSVSGLMVFLGQLFKVEYDGWESTIQPRA